MCDTLVALPTATADGSVILAKNSDREANEAQQLEYHPPRDWPAGSQVSCTYIKVPQAARTCGVLLSRPFWMWGAEMGVNEYGVAIGNEAVFTRMPVARAGVLTGMDMLRLALERSATAAAAKDMLIRLLHDYGQGGIAGYRDKSFRYHNSFLIADPQEAWALETAGPFWAAKKVQHFYAISNGLTIGSDYDDIHPEAGAYAHRKGWVKGPFSFAAAFSDRLYTRFSACRLRQGQSETFLRAHSGALTPALAMQHLRSHYREPYAPDGHWLSSSVCAHAGNPLTRHASQTTASLVAHLSRQPLVWATATSAPCLSVFKPVWLNSGQSPLPPEPTLTRKYDPHTYWWHFECLHRLVLHDFPGRAGRVRQALQPLEREWLRQVYDSGQQGAEISRQAFEQARHQATRLTKELQSLPTTGRPGLLYRTYWQRLNRQAGLRL